MPSVGRLTMSVIGVSPCLLCWPDYAKASIAPNRNGVVQTLTPTFSGPSGGWTTTMPIANLGLSGLYTPARSADLTTAHTQFTIDKKVSRPVRIAALIRHNLSSDLSVAQPAQVRFTVGDDNTFATFSYQSAWITVFGSAFEPYALPQGWSGWFDGVPTVEDLAAFASLSCVVDCGDNQIGRYERWEINDPNNGNGYVQIGGVFSGPAYQPQINMSYSPKLYAEDTATSTQGDTGVEFWTTRTIRRIAEFQLDNIQTDEALELAFKLQMQRGVAQPLFFVLDPGTPQHLHRGSFLARQKQLSPLENAYYDRWSMPIQLREVI